MNEGTPSATFPLLQFWNSEILFAWERKGFLVPLFMKQDSLWCWSAEQSSHTLPGDSHFWIAQLYVNKVPVFFDHNCLHMFSIISWDEGEN